MAINLGKTSSAPHLLEWIDDFKFSCQGQHDTLRGVVGFHRKIVDKICDKMIVGK